MIDDGYWGGERGSGNEDAHTQGSNAHFGVKGGLIA